MHPAGVLVQQSSMQMRLICSKRSAMLGCEAIKSGHRLHNLGPGNKMAAKS